MTKRWMCGVLATAMMLGMTACGDDSAATDTATETAATTALDVTQSVTGTTAKNEEETAPTTPSDFDKMPMVLEADDMQYVLIYNPNVYSEKDKAGSRQKNLSTGDLNGRINVDINRADDLDEDGKLLTTVGLYGLSDDMSQIEIDRVDAIHPIYKKGDTRDFMTYDNLDNGEVRVKRSFTCAYAGTHCNIWLSDTDMTAADVEKYGKVFDETIYEREVSIFSEPFFEDKIQFLFYPMDQSGAVGGAFTGYDLFYSPMVSEQDANNRGYNPNHNMLGVNTVSIASGTTDEEVSAVIAHEFQHMLHGSAAVNNGGAELGEWLNETMSGYVEEVFYPGIQKTAGRYRQLERSDLIRNGQSLYNFTTTHFFTSDIGVYGSVFVFSQYLENLCGQELFTDIHSALTYADENTLNDAQILVDCVPPDVYDSIDQTIEYPDSIVFKNENEEWLSKLTLDFYLSMLHYDAGDPTEYQNITATNLLYDQINAANIEGGGRVIVAIDNGTFEIPEDAGEGLVYVGLNGDFEAVTTLLCN